MLQTVPLQLHKHLQYGQMLKSVSGPASFREEWVEYVNEHSKEFLGVENAGKMFGYIEYGQALSCKPPKVFVIVSEWSANVFP